MVDKGKLKKEEEINGSGGGKELMLVPSSNTSATGGSSYESPLPVREAAPSSSYLPYPSPLSKYEEVAANPKLFMVTLEKLHHAMGTKFMIPIIGGKELDLHRLFLEVTSRGGIEKVLKEKRWKEVTAVFNFPSTATNASFILRKYYISLIYHYEQIYFFGAQGWNPSSPDSLSSPSLIAISAKSSREPSTQEEAPVATAHKRSKVNTSLGSPVIGVIDGKFDHGYLVTVSVGTEKLKGILYHPFDHRAGHVPPYFGNVAYNMGKDSVYTGVRRRRRRKKSEMRRRDPAHPKPNRSGYNFFFAEQHARLKPLHPGKDREISKMIGELWNNLTETGKAVYQEKGVKDKERYRSEMEEYKERLRTGQVIISNAVPIQQRHAAPEVDMVEAVGQEMEADEGDLLETPENSSSSGGNGSEEKTLEKDSETEVSAGAVNDAESGKVAGDTEGDSYELKKREQEGGDEGSNIGNMEEEELEKKEFIYGN